MKKEIPNFYPGQECFFCGQKNRAGLGLKFFIDEETGEVSTEYLASPPFAGLGNILHGGIQAGLFDEIMGWTAHYFTRQMGVTSEINAQFLKPVYLGKRLSVFCRVAARLDRTVRLEARIESSEGEVLARASGAYRLLPKKKFESLVKGPEL